jgi:hypothetical protein
MKRLALAALLSAALHAAAMDCPDPPKQAQKDWETQIKLEVGRIGVVRGAELQSRVQSVTTDLLTKLPGADKLYLEQMMFSAYCTALRDDRQMPESDKARQILDYRRELARSFAH